MTIRRHLCGLGAVSEMLLTSMGASMLTLSAAQAATPVATPAAEEELAEVVVTGTNIRGVAPVGEPIIELGRAEIERTAVVSVQQLLQTAAPQVNGFGSAGQGNGSFEPRLRSLGGSSSAATLVLVDGHRINPGGGVANTADPNIIPVGAVERVEVLADGASAVYGSDAVAGVINIITRKNYQGTEFSGQMGFGDSYKTQDFNGLFGRSWGSGGMLASYQYSHRSNLFAGDRDFVQGNRSNSGAGATGEGGANFNTFACNPATVVPATGQPGAGLVFQSPYATGTGIVNNSTLNGLCSTVRAVDLLPDSMSHRVYLSAHQDIGERIKVGGSLVWGKSQQRSQVSRGTITNVTVYGPGSTPAGGVGQINPFFVGPPGVTQETISYDFNRLLGPGAQTLNVQTNLMASLTADVELGHTWVGNFMYTVGDPRFSTTTTGVVSAPNAYLAINGSAVPGGSLTGNLIGNALGSNTVVSRVPLTVNNAFNPFLAGAPGTSAAVMASLLNGQSFSASERPLNDFVAKFNGTLFHIPGGDVKAAVGGEYFSLGQTSNAVVVSPLGGGTQSQDLYSNTINKTRKVTSGFVEINAPLVSPEMGVPGVRSLVVDAAGRIDRYNDLASDVATTHNPKFGVNWEPIENLMLRAAYGTSFVAPTVGATQLGTVGSTITSYFGNGGAAFTLPQGYANSSALGCPATGTCTVTSGGGRDGIIVFGGNPNLKPMTGKEWSAGFDWKPENFLRGLRLSVTVWGANFDGVITNQANVTVAANTPGLESVLVIAPTAAQIAAATTGRTATTALPATISFINNIVQDNFFNFRSQGLDFDVSYTRSTGLGTFTIGQAGAMKTKFKKQIGTGPWVEALNVANTTNTFSPIRYAARTNLGWSKGSTRADLYLNYVNSYYATDANAAFANGACPVNVTATGLGCQTVKANLTVDAHANYEFTGDGFAKQLQVYLDASNLLDKKPPFVNATDSITPNGALNVWASPIGRVISVGFRKKL